MSLHQASVKNVNWSVIWRKNGKWVRKRFGDDFPEAMKLFLAKRAQKSVLHSDNVGFPAPRRITHHEVEKWDVVTKRGRRFKKKRVVIANLMRVYNERGIWWCPYCIQLRPFALIETDRGSEMYCPVCQITNYDWHVRHNNPKASIIEQRRRPRRTSARRSRRRK